MLLPLLSVLCFFLGVLSETFLDFAPLVFVCLLILLLLLKNKKLALLVFSFCFGVFRMQIYMREIDPEFAAGFAELEGTIDEEVDLRSDKQYLTIQTSQGRVLVSTSPYSAYNYGERLKITGELEKPQEGSYSNYLLRYGILYTMDRAKIQTLGAGGRSFFGILYDLKGVLQRRINQLYFEPEASLVSGLLLGSRRGMSPELSRDFQATGLTHVVAISGYNISLVIACVFSVFAFLPIKKRVILSIVLITIFVIFVGASAAAVRSGIMGSISMWGLYTGRKSQAFFGLIWSAFLMTIWNPAILVFDIGFQLSFASTLGLLCFAPILQNLFPWKGFIWDALLLTLSAQVSTFPFIVFYFGRLSVISPLANLLVAPFLPFAMLFTALSLLFSPFAVLGDFYVRSVIIIVHYLAKIPFADVEWHMSSGQFVLTLLSLFFLAFLFYKSKWARAFGLYHGQASSRVLTPSSQKHLK